MSDDFFYQSRETEALSSQQISDKQFWKVLIVDDEEEIHHITRLTLEDFTYDNRYLQFLSAYTGAQAMEILQKEQDIALVLLDVVMETGDAGLQVVKFIREELCDFLIRIILRTGQPGEAPEEKIVRDFDINDYKEKSELTIKKLYTALYSSLRSYQTLKTVEEYREKLEERVVDQALVIKEKEEYFSMLFNATSDAMILVREGIIQEINPAALILYGYDSYEEMVEKPYNMLLASDEEAGMRNRASMVLTGSHKRKDGESFPVEYSRGSFVHDGRRIDCIVSRDISEYKNNLKKQADYLDRINTLLADVQSLSHLLQEDKGAEDFGKSIREYGISRQEENVVYYLNEGLSNREIGEKLYIHEYTVKKHVSSIFKKLDVTTRSKLIGFLQSQNIQFELRI